MKKGLLSAEVLRKLSRFELKGIIASLAETCGEEVVGKAIEETCAISLKEEDRQRRDESRSSPCVEKKYVEDCLSSKVSGTASNAVKKRKMDDMAVSGEERQTDTEKKRKEKTKKEFDMSMFARRHIALHVGYFGKHYRGLVVQDSTDETIEHHLFNALEKVKLIQDRASCNFSRCGRTDAGVSALGQIVTLTVRSNLHNPQPPESAIPASKSRPGGMKPDKENEEIDFPRVINKALPKDIFVLGWAPAPSLEFQARFNADTRTYRYYFKRRDLDLEAIRKAAAYLVGTHDFRNFCKMDVDNVKNFVRRIESIHIFQSSVRKEPRENLMFFEVKGTAFLWHQIRCMVQILLLVGRSLEKPEIIEDLLDIGSNPRRPQYDYASELPLILYASDYSERDLNFHYCPETLIRLRQNFELMKAELDIESELRKGVIDFIDNLEVKDAVGEAIPFRSSEQFVHLNQDFQVQFRKAPYRPISSLQQCETYDEKVARLTDNKKQKIKEKHGWDL